MHLVLTSFNKASVRFSSVMLPFRHHVILFRQNLRTNIGLCLPSLAGLGPGTIVGSAAFNVFPILAVCVLVPKNGTVKKIANLGVYVVELAWSMWAYIWLLIILQV